MLVVDGGLANSRCYMELLNLRKDLLSALNLSDQAKNKDYQLHLTLVATHSHKDHIAALYSEIIPCKFFAIDALYVSPATALVTDNTQRPGLHTGLRAGAYLPPGLRPGHALRPHPGLRRGRRADLYQECILSRPGR